MYSDMDILDREVSINFKIASSVVPLPVACSRFAANFQRTPSQLEAQQPQQQPQEQLGEGKVTLFVDGALGKSTLLADLDATWDQTARTLDLPADTFLIHGGAGSITLRKAGLGSGSTLRVGCRVLGGAPEVDVGVALDKLGVAHAGGQMTSTEYGRMAAALTKVADRLPWDTVAHLGDNPEALAAFFKEFFPPPAGAVSTAAAGAAPETAAAGNVQPTPPKRRKVVGAEFTPSKVAGPDIYTTIQQPPQPWVPCFQLGRDPATVPELIPAQLSHPAFEKFCHATHHSSEEPPARFVEFAAEVCTALQPYHLEEKEMATAVLPALRKVLGGAQLMPCFHGSRTGANTDPRDDGQVSHVVSLGGASGDITLASLPSNNADPLIENLGYQKLIYEQIVDFLNNAATTEQQKVELLRYYPFPTLLLTITGVDVQVHGASIAGTYAEPISATSEHLSPKCTFTWPRHGGARVVELARLLFGVHEAAAALSTFYTVPPPATLPSPTLPSYPLPYDMLHLFDSMPEHVADGKLLWRGRRRSDKACSGGGNEVDGGGGSSSSSMGSGGGTEHIIVKYAEEYSLEVHTQWAEAGLAPRLIEGASAEGLPGNYTRVVTPDLRHHGYRVVSSLPAAEKAVAARLAREALEHVPPGTVHGDLRTDNALLGPPTAMPRLLFIDFEWAGRDGATKYPLDLNVTAFHNGANAGAPIMHQHDVDMVALWK